MKIKKVIVFLLVAALVGGSAVGGIYSYKSYQDKSRVVEVQPVSSLNWGYYGDSETSYGMVTNDSAQEIYLDDSKSVETVFVSEGDTVEEGAPLLQYNMEEVQIDIQRKRLDISTIENNIAIAAHMLDVLRQTKPVDKKRPEIDMSALRKKELEDAIEKLESLPERDERDNRIYNFLTEDSVPYNAGTADGSEQNPYIYYCNRNVYAYGSFFNEIRAKKDGTPGKYVKFVICKKDSDGKMVMEPEKPGTSETEEPGTSETQEPGTSETQEPGTSETQQPGTSETQEPGTSETQEPGTSETQEPGTSETQQPGTSETQEPGTSETQQPGTSETQQPGTSETQQPGTSETQQPGTSETQQPGTSETQQPGTSETQQPGTSETQQPGTSETQQPGTSETQQPGTSETQQPGTSETQQPGTSETQQPGTSETRQPGGLRRSGRICWPGPGDTESSGEQPSDDPVLSALSTAVGDPVRFSGRGKKEKKMVPVPDGSVVPNTIVFNGNNFPTVYDEDRKWYIFTGEEVGNPLQDLLDQIEEEQDWEEPDGYSEKELAEAIEEKQEELKKLDLELRQEKLKLESLESAASDGVVYAKMAGVVKSVGSTDGDDGYGAFLVLAGDDGLYVSGTISELLLDTVKPGTVVTANSWESGNTFQATVTEISDYPVSGNSWGEGNPNVSYYEYTAYIEDSSALKNGEYVDLSIAANQAQTESGEEAIYIEKAYVRQENGRSYCMIADENDRLKKQYVVTGKTVYGSAVEIKSGLSESDRIAFPYGKNAIEGAAVTEGSEGEMFY